MIKVLHLFTYLFIINSSQAQNAGGEIKLNSLEFNYGTLNKGADAVCEFTVKNDGKFPLIINQCSASCGCTVPTCPTDPIAPGKSDVIRIKYKSDNVGSFNKNITVYSNDETNPMIVLKVTGIVIEKSE